MGGGYSTPASVVEVIDNCEDEIVLRSAGLRRVPPELCRAVSVSRVVLSHNSIDVADVAPLSRLPKLSVLELQKNGITEVVRKADDAQHTATECAAAFEALEELYLSSNRLRRLSFSSLTCKNIRTLDVARNRDLELLEEMFLELPSLRTLVLDETAQRVLPSTIHAMTELVELSARGCCLTSLPDELFAVSTLGNVDVSGNQLAALSSAVGAAGQLKFLNVSGNRIATLPNELAQLRELLYCDARDNPIDEIPPQLNVLRKVLATSLPDEISPGLFLGSAKAAANRRALEVRRITTILTVGSELQMPFVEEEEFEYKKIEAQDTNVMKLSPHFEECSEYIEKGLASGRAILVHCQQGVSRSATVVTAYLMWKQRIGRDEALAIVRQGRPKAKPNNNFMEQLEEYERTLRALPH